jgi:pyrroline-5-carboxylate reductase
MAASIAGNSVTAKLTKTIGFVGAGQMARALARGFVRAGLVSDKQILAFDPSPAALDALKKELPGAVVAHTNERVLLDADVAFLAVKPQHVAQVASEVELSGADTLLVSIAAGITLARLEELFKTNRIVRVMPNTPCLVGLSAAGYCSASGATTDDRSVVQQLLAAVGIAFELDEKLLDAVTGLSGSGPAFVYVMIEALSDGGVRMGLPRHVATQLAAQTVRGAAEMVLATKEHPAVLKDQVASPGGTTIAGLQAMENSAVRAGLIAAVEAATRRSAELGRA